MRLLRGQGFKTEFVTDVSFKTFIGRGSGESIQMKFTGSGFVVVQPFEEVYTTNGNQGEEKVSVNDGHLL